MFNSKWFLLLAFLCNFVQVSGLFYCDDSCNSNCPTYRYVNDSIWCQSQYQCEGCIGCYHITDPCLITCDTQHSCRNANITLDYNIHGANLTCDGTTACQDKRTRIWCNSQNACRGMNLYQNKGVNSLLLECTGTTACQEMILFLYGNNNVNIICDTSSACEDIQLNVYNNSIVNVHCLKSTSCRYMTINNNNGGDITIHCDYDKSGGCRYLNMKCNDINSICNMSCTSDKDDDCRNQNITCYNSATCIVSGMQLNSQLTCFPGSFCICNDNYPCITFNPTVYPSVNPTTDPTNNPSLNPTVITSNPSTPPSLYPSKYPTIVPSLIPTSIPTQTPSKYPTTIPSLNPTKTPSKTPSRSLQHQPTIAYPQNTTIVPISRNNNKSNDTTTTAVATTFSILAVLIAIGLFYWFYWKPRSENKEGESFVSRISSLESRMSRYISNSLRNKSVTTSQVELHGHHNSVTRSRIQSDKRVISNQNENIDNNNENIEDSIDLVEGENNNTTTTDIGNIDDNLVGDHQTPMGPEDNNTKIKQPKNENNNKNNEKEESNSDDGVLPPHTETLGNGKEDFGEALTNVQVVSEFVMDDIVDEMNNDIEGGEQSDDDILPGIQTNTYNE